MFNLREQFTTEPFYFSPYVLPAFQTLDAFLMGKPGTSQMIQWENHILYKVAGKMFCILSLVEDDRIYEGLGIKIDPEDFDELTQDEAIRQMSHSAKRMWVSIDTHTQMPWPELQRRITRSYDLVVSKLPKKMQRELAAEGVK